MYRIYQNIGEQIRKARKLKGFTQRRLASEIGKSSVMISYYEQGKRRIDEEDLQKIAESTDQEIIFFYENEKPHDLKPLHEFRTILRQFDDLRKQLLKFEHKRHKIEESTKTYFQAFSNSSDAMFLMSEEGNIYLVNKAFKRIFDCYSNEQNIKVKFSNFFKKSGDFEKCIENLKDHKTWRGKLHLKKNEGDVLVYANLLHLEDDQGAVKGFMGILSDLTEQHKIEEDIELKNRALDALSSGVIITDATQEDNPIISTNPAFEKITGYTQKEVLGKNCRFLQSDPSQKEVREKIKQSIQSETSSTTVIKNKRKDGSEFWNELTVSPVKDTTGKTTHFIGIQNDVTKQMHQFQELKLLRNFIDSLADAIYIRETKNGELIYANEKAYKMLGYTLEEFKKLTFFDIYDMPVDQIQKGVEHVKKEKHVIIPTIQKKKNGDRIKVEVNARIVTIGDNEYFVSIARDLTTPRKKSF